MTPGMTLEEQLLFLGSWAQLGEQGSNKMNTQMTEIIKYASKMEVLNQPLGLAMKQNQSPNTSLTKNTPSL